MSQRSTWSILTIPQRPAEWRVRWICQGRLDRYLAAVILTLQETDMNRLFSSIALGALAFALCPFEPGAQAAGSSPGPQSKVIFENDQMRVVEYLAQPGEDVCGEAMHSHPAHLTVIFDQAKVRETTPDGHSMEVEPPKGFAFWSEASTHSVINIGTTPSRALLIEMKQPEKRY
jgi:hypothetical protein